MRDLEGKLALVTGGGKGVGKVIVRQLADRGAHILLNFFHSLDQAKETKVELETAGATVDLFRASVARQDQVERMFKEIEAKYGGLDILVNNAASGRLVPVEGVTDEWFARALDTNLKGSFWCARAAAPLIARRGGGCIVNISSIGAGFVPANYVVVGTSKAALEALTRYLAVEYAPLNIRVNTASCTLIEGDVARAFPHYEEVIEVTIASTPMRRLATSEDLAGVVKFLTSAESQWVTGQTILADGGLSLGSVMMSPRPQSVSADIEALRVESRSEPMEPRVPTAADGRERIPQHVATEAESVPRQPAITRREVPRESDDIAVVGMGLIVPGANNPDAFWKVLIDGPNLFRRVPEDRWDYRSFFAADPSAEDKSYQPTSVFVTQFSPSAALVKGLAGDTAGDDSTALWLRHALLQALQGVGRRPDDRFSFVIGYTADGSQHLEESQVISGMTHRLEAAMGRLAVPAAERAPLRAAIDAALRARYWRGTGEPLRFLPHNVGRRGMEGILPEDTELFTVDTACSSSLYAIDIGVKGLLMGERDIALCGGSFSLAPRGSVLFSKLHGLSTSGVLRPLDKGADGVLFSDGAGVVALKRLRRALEDGDRVLAVIKAFGASSDGKGKAIYAPSSEGQRLAVERAHSQSGGKLAGIDWIIAHATGTPAGDLAEFQNLRETYAGEQPVYVTSNKSLIGHTGWAAGAVSVIEAIVGLHKEAIPPQHRFSEPPVDFHIETTNLTIPKAPVPWPAKPDEPRRAAVSGFGFGGTNAHLVVEEYPSPAVSSEAPEPRRPYEGRIVIVGWSARVPGLLAEEQVEAWLAGTGPAPEHSFGDVYPQPSFDKVRLPPATIRTIDRCQLMVIECAHQLRRQLGDFWELHRTRTGVILGHMGATRSSTLYAARTYLDDVATTLRNEVALSGSRHVDPLLESLSADVRRLVPPANENSFPGMMPNVIPARIANYFDLNGLNMTIDTGVTSALSAFRVAIAYLRSGELDMALVGGANGNTTPEVRQMLGDRITAGGVELAEGTFILALTTEDRARDAHLPILGYLTDDETVVAADAAGAARKTAIDCGLDGTAGGAHYLGAQGAVAVLRVLHGRSPATVITCRDPKLGAATRISVESSMAPHDQIEEKERVRTPPGVIPTRFCDAGAHGAERPLEVQRYVATLEEYPHEAVRPRLGFFPPGTVVLTDRPELLEPLADALGETVVISTRPLAADRPMHFFLPTVTPEAVDAVLSTRQRPIRHVRVVTDLSAAAALPDSLWEESAELVTLHDLLLLVLKACYEQLTQEGASFVGLFLHAVASGVIHPFGGLFSGLMKATALELPRCLTYGVFTSAGDVRTGVRQAEDESSARHFLPLVVYDGSVRKSVFVDEQPGHLAPDTPARVDETSVVVAVGGARGITAELMKALAEHFRPRIYLIGSTRLDTFPSSVFEGTDEEFARRRPEFIRTQRAAHPEKSPGQLNKEFERMRAARDARANLAEMARHSGSNRVSYLSCDVLDREALSRALGTVLRAEEKIDLLINSPGINRAASIPVKSFADFRAVRDLKLRCYQNLKFALRDHPPRMWCNFGSFIGLTGQLGELDYAAANDFLTTCAAYSNRVLGRDEFTIGWTLWREVGLGANPVTRGFLEKSGLFTSMTTEEGVYHFIREINLSEHPPSTVHLGGSEKRAILDHLPGYFDARVQRPVDEARLGFYLGRLVAQEKDEAVFERVFDLEKDPYLRDHLVNGYPTLPGTFVTEIAAEAASWLVPELHVVGVEDATFHHFLRVYDTGRPQPKRIHAKVIEQGDGRAAVRVRIMTDIVAPNGRILTRDKLHFEITARLARTYPPAPYWEPWGADGEIPIPDPYHMAGAPVLLTGPLVSTRNTRSHPIGKRAMYHLAVAGDDAIFSRFLVPSVMLDGLARVAVLEIVDRDYIPLCAPSSIRRIDFYEAGNDCQLAHQYHPIELYVTPKAFTLEDPSAQNRFVAVRPDGRMILQMKGVIGIILGYVHRETGEFVAREELERRQRMAPGVPAGMGGV